MNRDGCLLLLHHYMIYSIEFEIVLIQIKKEKKVNFVVVDAVGCVYLTLAVN